MNRTPRYWHSKNGKIAQKSHIIQHGGQTVRLTTKSHKKPNILQKISFPHSGLRFLIRPTVRPQFTKIGGSEQGPKKIFPKFFLAFSQYLGTPKTISLKNFSEFFDSKWVKIHLCFNGSPIQVLTRPNVAWLQWSVSEYKRSAKRGMMGHYMTSMTRWGTIWHRLRGQWQGWVLLDSPRVSRVTVGPTPLA